MAHVLQSTTLSSRRSSKCLLSSSQETANFNSLVGLPLLSPEASLIWRTDHHKIVVDDESYNYGHGHVYEFLGIEPREGAVIIVRPDQYVSMVSSIDNAEVVARFFDGIFKVENTK